MFCIDFFYLQVFTHAAFVVVVKRFVVWCSFWQWVRSVHETCASLIVFMFWQPALQCCVWQGNFQLKMSMSVIWLQQTHSPQHRVKIMWPLQICIIQRFIQSGAGCLLLKDCSLAFILFPAVQCEAGCVHLILNNNTNTWHFHSTLPYCIDPKHFTVQSIINPSASNCFYNEKYTRM